MASRVLIRNLGQAVLSRRAVGAVLRSNSGVQVGAVRAYSKLHESRHELEGQLKSNVEEAWTATPSAGGAVTADASSEVAYYPLPVYSNPEWDGYEQAYADAIAPVQASEPSPFTKYGVIPVTLLAAAGMISKEIITFGAETVAAAAFGAFTFTAYVQMRDVANAEITRKHYQGIYDERANTDALIEAVQLQLSALDKRKTLTADLGSLSAVTASLSQKYAVALQRKYWRMIHNDVLAKFSEIDHSEKSYLEQLRKDVIVGANDHVVKTLSSDKNLREKIFQSSLQLLAAGPGKKAAAGSDPLVELYKNYFKDVREKARKERSTARKLSAEERQKWYSNYVHKCESEGRTPKPFDQVAPTEVKAPEWTKVFFGA